MKDIQSLLNTVCFLTSLFLQIPNLCLEIFIHFLCAFLVSAHFSHLERSLKLI